MKHKINLLTQVSLLTLAFLLGSIVAFAQATSANLSGTYEALVNVPNRGEQKVTLELKTEGGKISARAINNDKATESTDGKLENGTLTLNFGNQRTIIVKVDGDKLVGEAADGSEKIPVEFKKVTTAAAAPPSTTAAEPAAAAFNLSGNWEAVADANGQPFPFSLTLKVDGETVTGNSTSQLGDSTVKSGTWKDGKLVFQLEGQNGVVTLSATVVEGKLSGEFDFAGQLQGRWVAVRKN